MLLTVASLCTLLCLQEPAPPELGESPVAEQQDGPEVEVWDEARTRSEIAEYRKAVRGGKVGRDERAEAVAELARGSNKRLVAEFYKIIVDDPESMVRRAAARGFVHQPGASVAKAVRKLLEKPELRDDPALLAILVRTLDQRDYEAREDWPLLRELFELDYQVVQVPLKRAILNLIAHHREERALSFLVEYIDPPAPEDPDSPDNPPASYWKARWDEWMVWRIDLARTLQELTGQIFSSTADAQDWLREQRGKPRSRAKDAG